QPETAKRRVPGGMALRERLEDLLQQLGIDADAVVLDRDFHQLAVAAAAQGDPAALRRELDRVGQQIREYLLQPLIVAPDPQAWIRKIERQLDVLRRRVVPDRIEGGLER